MISEIKQPQKTNSGWFHLHKVLGIVASIETESRMVVAGPGGQNEEFLCKEYRVLQDEKSYEDGW